MTQPIGSGSSSRQPYDYPINDAEQASLDYCKKADTVASGYLCAEPTVVSNACRRPNNELDDALCDDKWMKHVQDTIVKGTLQILKQLAFIAIGGKAR